MKIAVLTIGVLTGPLWTSVLHDVILAVLIAYYL